MDPLVSLHLDVHCLIFQHFDFKEILEISQVSKFWNKSIGCSSCCMKKIALILKYKTCYTILKQEIIKRQFEVVKNTNRFYQNISIDCRFDNDLSKEFWKTLKLLKSSVIELKIKCIKHESTTPLELPRLEVLRLTYAPRNITNILLSGSSSLKKIKIKSIPPLKWSAIVGRKNTSKLDLESLASVRNCMYKNHLLQELELNGFVQYKSFFDEDFSEVVRFQLKSLKVKSGLRLVLVPESNEDNLINFLGTQSSCLERIFIDICRPKIVEYIFTKMPALSSIHLDVVILDRSYMNELNLGLNERIRDLKIPYVNQNSDIEEFLAAVPNLELLFVSHLTLETMDFIARNLMNLKTLKYRYEDIDCEDFYENLKDEFPEVNQDIEMIVDYDYN